MLSRIARRLSTGKPALGWKATGNIGQADHRVFLTVGGTVRSFWHDLPLFGTNKDIVTYISEIPIHSTAKYEISLKEPANPIKQDTNKDGSLRYFKAGPIPFNYGASPQTWENPNTTDKRTGLLGDGDPIDIVELSNGVLETGAVYKVKVLGILGLIDQGETDWKVLAIREGQTLSEQDYNKKVEQVIHWFRTYKIPEGKAENKFAFDGKVLSKSDAIDVILETHHEWKSQYSL
jgi:inorganic pyrophosphatase